MKLIEGGQCFDAVDIIENPERYQKRDLRQEGMHNSVGVQQKQHMQPRKPSGCPTREKDTRVAMDYISLQVCKHQQGMHNVNKDNDVTTSSDKFFTGTMDSVAVGDGWTTNQKPKGTFINFKFVCYISLGSIPAFLWLDIQKCNLP